MDVLIKKVRYVQGIPAELTEKAVNAGEIRRGSIVGLDVEFIGYGTQALIDLKIAKDGQEKLVRDGCHIPVEEANSLYFMTGGWTDYLETPRCEKAVKNKSLQAGKTQAESEGYAPALDEKALSARPSRFDKPIGSSF